MTLKVSELERIIVKQTTLAQEWKMQRDTARALEAAKSQGMQQSCPKLPLLHQINNGHAKMSGKRSSTLNLAADADGEAREGFAEQSRAQANGDASEVPADDVMQDGPEEDGQMPSLCDYPL